MGAAVNSGTDMCRHLMAAGGDWTARDNNGTTAEEHARQKQSEDAHNGNRTGAACAEQIGGALRALREQHVLQHMRRPSAATPGRRM